MRIHLVLPMPPSSNHYKKPRRRVGKRFSGFFLTPEARRFIGAVQGHARKVTPITKGFVEVVALVYRGEKRGKLQRGDLHNYEKVLFDSLQGVAYRNDSQIRRSTMELREDRLNPRVEVMITEFQPPKKPKRSRVH